MATMTPKDAALHLWKLGANITAIPEGGKEPDHEWNSKRAPWATERQPSNFLSSLKWRTQEEWWNGRRYPQIETVGIINGINAWRSLDIDARVGPDGQKRQMPPEVRARVLAALGLADDYPWCGPSKSGKGLHVWVICEGDIPDDIASANERSEPGVKLGDPLPEFADAFDHLELRWERCQTVLPSPTGYNGHLPSAPPARVTVAQIEAAFRAIAMPQRRHSGPPDKPGKVQQAQRSAQAHYDRPDVIGAFNDRYTVADILERNGYQVLSGGWSHPRSSQPDVVGVRLADDGKAQSFSATDPLNDGHNHDAFDCFRILEHHQDIKAAVKAAASGLGLTATPRASTSATQEAAGDDTRPVVDVTSMDLPAVAAAAWDALIVANEPPTLFRSSDELVRLERSDSGPLRLVRVDEARMRGALARAARFVRFDHEGNERGVDPPASLVDDCLVNLDPRLPRITRVVTVPTFAPDGSLIQSAGYHPRAGLYYDPRPGLTIRAVAEQPAAADIHNARALLLDELLVDFPFTSDADKAHAVALFLLPYVRELIAGPTPLHLIEAPTMGSGKSLLAEVLLIPALGGSPAPFTEARDDEEWRKRITAALLDAPGAIVIDNLRRTLDTPALAAALTTTEWQDRRLGLNTTVRAPVRCTWVATANNPTLSTEISRRCVRIRISPDSDQPWRREGFKHTELRTWVQEHSGDLIWAALTLARAGLQQGPTRGPKLGSYEQWSDLMRRILSAAGLPGFLNNLDALYDRADVEGAAWRAFIGAWWEAHGDEEVRGPDLLDLARSTDLPIGGKDEGGQKRALGKALVGQADRIFSVKMADKSTARVQVVDAGTKQHVRVWQLKCISTGPAPAPPAPPVEGSTSDGELGECGEFSDTPRAHMHAPAHVRERVDHAPVATSENSPNSQHSRAAPAAPLDAPYWRGPAIWHGPEHQDWAYLIASPDGVPRDGWVYSRNGSPNTAAPLEASRVELLAPDDPRYAECIAHFATIDRPPGYSVLPRGDGTYRWQGPNAVWGLAKTEDDAWAKARQHNEQQHQAVAVEQETTSLGP